MIDVPEQLANRLIRPWTAHGSLLFREKMQCVEVEVPMLALDAEEVARAIASNVQYVKRPSSLKDALRPGVTEDEQYDLAKKWTRELTIAERDLTLAAAILARRACASPIRVTVDCLDHYVARHIWRGGSAPGNPAQTEFLFIAGGSSPTIFVCSDALAAMTSYVGAEFLSVLVSGNELRLRIKDATDRLAQSKSPAPRSLTNMEDWFSHRKQKIGDEHEE